MKEVAKNILVNAAMSTGQNVDKTLQLAAKSLNNDELERARDLMLSGVKINHKTVSLIG